MKFHRICAGMLAAAMVAGALIGCAAQKTEDPVDTTGENVLTTEDMEDDLVPFRPVDCGVQPQDVYEFPFMGMMLTLTQNMLDKMETKEVFVFTHEDYTDDWDIAYAFLRFSATTEEDREGEQVMSSDVYSWEVELEKVGAIGVYRQEQVAQLDTLTGCDVHEEVGQSEDGTYRYYLSTNSGGNEEFVAELKQSNVFPGEMHPFDPSLGYTAFSPDRVQNVTTVGEFSMEDVFGESYDQTLFQEYDLTLVNLFATWCEPCTAEMSDLEALRQQYAQKGIRLGVVAVVLDAKNGDTIDEGALERAQALHESSGAQFPFLIPDEGEMNGRLTGVATYPESFFVDGDGNIVSEAYVGAHSLDGWVEIVEEQLGGSVEQ